jgi:hypothetical protein
MMNNAANGYCDRSMLTRSIKYPRCRLQRLSEEFRHE